MTPTTKTPKRTAVVRPRRILSAKGKSLGRVAAEAARLLQGKHNATYVRHQDVGCWVLIKDASAAKFTGHKLGQKKYHSYSGYPGGLMTRSLERQWKERPEKVIRDMVYHMLPTNTMRKTWIKRLTITM